MKEYANQPKSEDLSLAFRLMIDAELDPEVQGILKAIPQGRTLQHWVVMVASHKDLPRLVVSNCEGRYEAQRAAELMQEAFDAEYSPGQVTYWACPMFCE